MEDSDKFKLITRRVIAWGLGGVATLALAFVVVWSQICPGESNEMASTATGGLIAIVSGIIGFYFSKKVRERGIKRASKNGWRL